MKFGGGARIAYAVYASCTKSSSVVAAMVDDIDGGVTIGFGWSSEYGLLAATWCDIRSRRDVVGSRRAIGRKRLCTRAITMLHSSCSESLVPYAIVCNLTAKSLIVSCSPCT